MKNLALILLLYSVPFARGADSTITCLPAEVTQDTLVSSAQTGLNTEPLRDVLRRLEARCEKGKLVNKAGREIHFVHLIGCWGNPPVDYQERLAAQAKEIEALRKNYTVVEIPCGTRNSRAIQ